MGFLIAFLILWIPNGPFGVCAYSHGLNLHPANSQVCISSNGLPLSLRCSYSIAYWVTPFGCLSVPPPTISSVLRMDLIISIHNLLLIPRSVTSTIFIRVAQAINLLFPLSYPKPISPYAYPLNISQFVIFSPPHPPCSYRPSSPISWNPAIFSQVISLSPEVPLVTGIGARSVSSYFFLVSILLLPSWT